MGGAVREEGPFKTRGQKGSSRCDESFANAGHTSRYGEGMALALRQPAYSECVACAVRVALVRWRGHCRCKEVLSRSTQRNSCVEFQATTWPHSMSVHSPL